MFTGCISCVLEADLDPTNIFVVAGFRLLLTVLRLNRASAKWLALSLYFEVGEARLPQSQAEVWLPAMKLALPKLRALARADRLRRKSCFWSPPAQRSRLLAGLPRRGVAGRPQAMFFC